MKGQKLSEYSFNLITGLISEPFFGPYGNNVIEDFGLHVPCNADEFHKNWSATSMRLYPHQREVFLKTVSVENLKSVFSESEEISLQYKITDKKGYQKDVRSTISRFIDSAGDLCVWMKNEEGS